MKIILTAITLLTLNTGAIAQHLSSTFVIDNDTTVKNSNVNYKSRGFTNATTVGIFYPVEDITGFTIESSNGFRFNPYFALCGTAEMDISSGYFIAPLSLNPRFNLIKGKKLQPFVNGNLGYAVTTNTDYRGAFFSFDYGNKYYIKNTTAILFSMEFRYFMNSNSTVVLLLKTGIQF